MWEGLRGGAEDDFVEFAGVLWGFGAGVDRAGSGAIGVGDEGGGGVDRAGGSGDEQNGGTEELADGFVEGEGCFAEPDDVWADGGAADVADGEGGGVEVEGAIGKWEVAALAARLEEAAVHVVEVVGAGALV